MELLQSYTKPSIYNDTESSVIYLKIKKASAVVNISLKLTRMKLNYVY